MASPPGFKLTIPPGADLLRWPLVGRFLRWRHARTALQLVLLGGAVVLVIDGLTGPEFDATNLATVLTWVHYRGLLIVVLLAAGNFFCMGCPFVLVRDAGRRVRPPWLNWPRALRTKWIGIALFVAVLFGYELFDLWALPRATAYLAIAYFGAALAIDVVFSGATFCKYLCPIGQFNFVASAVSPLEVHVRDTGTCRTCRTVDCIKGRRDPQAPQIIVQRGCELRLFQPLKVGNMDCTFCMDCVQACPHDNVAVGVRVPGAELADSRRRSGIGRLADRPDIAALIVIFVFGALLNALGMIQPMGGIERWLSRLTGTAAEAWVLAIVFIAVLGIAPLLLLGGAAVVTRFASADGRSPAELVVNYAQALVPFGVGTWAAHYGFHLLTGAWTIVPVTQNAAIRWIGWAALGEPQWRWTGLRPGVVFPIQIGLVLLGTLGSLAAAYQIAERDDPHHPFRASLPWIVVTVLLAVTAIWILAQPMEMRGMAVGG